MEKDFKKDLEKYFDKYNIKHNEEIINDFYDFTQYLLSENAKYNLTSITDTGEIIIKHYIDSIMILKYFDIPENANIIDIGSGAGFPGMPLAIMRPDLNITFLDSSNKKINFIKNALERICRGAHCASACTTCFTRTRNARPYEFITGRAEELGRDINIRESYDFAVSRAVARLNILCELASPFVKPGGYFIAYKARTAYEEIIEAENALKILDLEIEKIIEFDLHVGRDDPGAPQTPAENSKRVLIKIKKLKKTSPKYPRNFANITKNPL